MHQIHRFLLISIKLTDVVPLICHVRGDRSFFAGRLRGGNARIWSVLSVSQFAGNFARARDLFATTFLRPFRRGVYLLIARYPCHGRFPSRGREVGKIMQMHGIWCNYLILVITCKDNENSSLKKNVFEQFRDLRFPDFLASEGVCAFGRSTSKKKCHWSGPCQWPDRVTF